MFSILEIEERDPDKLIEIIASLEPTFGGINLEDIKAPECFYIEQKLRERMKIPVFHDDQHGTAIVVGAAILNGLHLIGKDLRQGKDGYLRRWRCGAGLPRSAGDARYSGREHLGDRHQGAGLRGARRGHGRDQGALCAKQTDARTLARSSPAPMSSSGLSAGGVLKPEMVAKMAPSPLIMALANPNPGDPPGTVKSVRSDAIMATGRSDYPNQVNNVLCFPVHLPWRA
jgi:malate dehydrogenase (oxaloacetate-decarboxylating)(NADP+)